MTDDYESDPDVETFHRMIRRGEIKSRRNYAHEYKRRKQSVAEVTAPNGGLRPNATRAQRFTYFVNRDRKT